MGRKLGASVPGCWGNLYLGESLDIVGVEMKSCSWIKNLTTCGHRAINTTVRGAVTFSPNMQKMAPPTPQSMAQPVSTTEQHEVMATRPIIRVALFHGMYSKQKREQ